MYVIVSNVGKWDRSMCGVVGGFKYYPPIDQVREFIKTHDPSSNPVEYTVVDDEDSISESFDKYEINVLCEGVTWFYLIDDSTTSIYYIVEISLFCKN